MAYQLVIEDKTDYLRVEVSAERLQGKEAQDAIQVWARVAEACRECEVSRILATLELTGRLPTMAAFEIAEDPVTFGWSR